MKKTLLLRFAKWCLDFTEMTNALMPGHPWKFALRSPAALLTACIAWAISWLGARFNLKAYR